MKNKIRIILFVVFLSIFGFSGFKLYTIYESYKIGDELYEDIEKEVFHIDEWNENIEEDEIETTQKTEQETKKTEEKTPKVTIDFKHLQSVNPDIKGWVYIRDTVISYPILQAEDNQKYLKLSYNNANSIFGSIFMDFRNNADFSDKNTIIYGHNMKNGSMFGMLQRYRQKEFYNKHKYIYVFQEERVLKYQIASMYIADATGKTYTIQFDDDTSYLDYLSMLASQSMLDTKLSLSTEDRVLTLSTCTSSGEDKRFVVHGKLVKEEKK